MTSFYSSSSSSLFLILLVLLCTYYFSCPCLSTRNLKENVGSKSTTIWGSMVGVEHKAKGARGEDIYNLGGGDDADHVARMKLHEVNSGPNPISNSFPSCSQSKTAAPSSSSSTTTAAANYSHQTIP